MFELLPQECLLMIIGFVLEEEPKGKGVSWKKKPTVINIRKKSYFGFNPSPFTKFLPLTMISKELNETFDTNEVWTHLYEKEFRKGKPYKRKPKNGKQMMIDKSKDIIRKRYEPVLEIEQVNKSKNLERIKHTMKQIHTLDTALSHITPQVRDRSFLDDDRKMDLLPIIMTSAVRLPSGYVNSGGFYSTYPICMTLENLAVERRKHQMYGTICLERKKKSKEVIEKIEGILQKL